MLLTDILCYNSTSGSVAFFSSDGSYSLRQSATRVDMWEPDLILVPGKFTSPDRGSTDHGVYADLLTYNQTAQQLQFYSTDGRGNRTAVGPAIVARHNWTHIKAGIFTPDGVYTDLLFYDQAAGVGEFYATDGAGGLTLLVSYPFAHWTSIVSAFFRPDAQTMDLLFYDASTGKAEFYSVWNGHITLMQSYDDWLTTWAQVVPGTFRPGGGTDDLLLYDPTRGLASFLSTDGQGGFQSIADYTDWEQDWSIIVPGYFLTDMTCSTLLIYSATRGAQGFLGIEGQANEIPLGGSPDFGSWTDIIPGKFLNSECESWRNFDESTLTRIEAYSSTDSVAPGDTVDFCIEAEQIHRGYYQFDYMIRVDRCGVPDFTFDSVGTAQPQDTPADAASAGCGWRPSISVPIPPSCRSGVYYATVTLGSLSTQVPFVVRPAAATASILLEIAVATMQAYNGWGGHSLYNGIPVDSESVPVVSLDRPYSVDTDPAMLAALPGFPYNRVGILSADFIEWLEINNNIKVDYCTSIDLHFARVNLGVYRLLISHWHDEYWSFEMRANVESFLREGGNVAFLGANTCWWQVRFDDSGRLLTCYKYVDDATTNGAPTDDPFAASGDSNLVKRSTIYWWDDRVNWPELYLTGLTFRYGWSVARTWPNTPARGYTVAQPDSWVFENTGLMLGEVFGQESGIIGGEVDSALGVYPYPDCTRFGNKYWGLEYPHSPPGFVELAYCDLYRTPGFAGFGVPISIVDSTETTLTVDVLVSPYPKYAPMAHQYIFQGSLAYEIVGVHQQGHSFVLDVSAPFVQQWSGENVVFVPTGWASMGLFQFAGDPCEFNGWVFNAGTVGWTNGCDPSSRTFVSTITLNVLRRLG
jgi:hypothetical protein